MDSSQLQITSYFGMADDTTIHEDNDNNGCMASLPTPVSVFEIQCKPEPCSNINNSTEDLSTFDESSTLYIPVAIPTIKSPIVLLERCDKIWKTLQLIKTVQIDSSTIIKKEKDYNEEEKEKETQAEVQVKEHSNETVQPISYRKHQRVLRNKTMPLPFKFSVQRTKKLYPCETCSKQYLERRSLRKHSERLHGIILPLQRKRNKIFIHKRNLKNVSSVVNEKSDNLEKHDYNKDSYRKITAQTNPKSVKTVAQQSPLSKRFVRCALCQQKVMSIRKHLTHYHKIGGSSSVMEQLESSVIIENKASPKNKKTTLKNILSGKLPNKTRNEENANKTSPVKRKQHNMSPNINATKRLKLNNESCSFVRNTMPTTMPTTQQRSLIVTSYKCDICLGMYSSAHSLYKHRRNHLYRGETKENFHKFKCRYLNSPLNKRYKLSPSSTDTTVNNIGDNINNSRYKTLIGQNSKTSDDNRIAHYNKRRNSNETTCTCGRSFRNPHTLFVHKEQCKLCKEDQLEELSDDKDSTNGISITIKKRNDSYEIVGKDNDNENILQESTPVKEDISSNISNTFNSTLKSSSTASTIQQELDTSESSNYSKDHSILKLQAIEEDVIIDIEDDVQIYVDKNNTAQQVDIQEDDKKSKQQDNKKNMKKQQVFDKVCTLREMCREILEKPKIGNAVGNKTQENNQITNQDIRQENKRELRSSDRRRQRTKKEFDYSYDGMKVCTTFDPLSACGYCDEKFDMVNLYDDHECTVKEGKSFDEFSLQLLCFYCKDILNNYNDYDNHVKVKHFDDAYHCYQCTERFTTDKARLSHFHREHNDSFCRFCNKKMSISIKILHEGYHLGFGYPCHKCKKAYTLKRNLSYHTSTIHSKKADNLMTCSICLRLVKLKTFRRHMKNHKHNACHFCGKLFSNRTGLELHTIIQHGTHSKMKGIKKKTYYSNE